MHPTYETPPRRQREGKTDYRRRLKLVRGRRPILVARRSNRQITLQLVTYEPQGDRTHLTVRSQDLRPYGYTGSLKNKGAAYLTGYLLGLRAQEKGHKGVILYLGTHASTPGNRLYAAVAGATEAGLEVPCDDEMLPEAPEGIGEIKGKLAQKPPAKKPRGGPP